MIGGHSKHYEGIYTPAVNEGMIPRVVKRKAFHELLQAKNFTMSSLAYKLNTTSQTVYRCIRLGYGVKAKEIESLFGMSIEKLSKIYNSNDLKEINK